MSEFFYACIELELHMNEEALTRYQDISAAGFTNSSYVNSQIAICLYNLRGIYYLYHFEKRRHITLGTFFVGRKRAITFHKVLLKIHYNFNVYLFECKL